MTKINILGEQFEIVEVEVIDDDETILGQVDHINNRIFIKLNMSNDKKKVTLIHEILHAVMEKLGFDDEHDNEHLIKSLATSIHQVFFFNDKPLF